MHLISLAPDSLLGREIGSHTLCELIGHGPLTWVFRAVGDDGSEAAVKVLRPWCLTSKDLQARFRNEFQVATGLRHRNVVRIHDVGRVGELTYFAMDFYPESLSARLDRDGPLDREALIGMTRDVAAALAFAHGEGVIHRDIKPPNILFAKDGRAVLADFGIARAVSGVVSATGADMTIGTPHYVSPEQAQGRPLDPRTDLYSLGVTLYRAATGSLPFHAMDWFELARMHVEQPPPPPRSVRPQVTEDMEDLILKLMAKLPADRFQSAEGLLAELDRLADRPEPLSRAE